MTQNVTLRPLGLATDPNPYSEAPPGSLLVASNCVIRRAGLIEPRPGFAASTVAASAKKPRCQFNFNDPASSSNTVIAFGGGSGVAFDCVTVGPFASQLLGTSPGPLRAMQPQAAEARDRFYYTTSTGLGCIREFTAAAGAFRAGLARPLTPYASESAGSATKSLVNGRTYAYRVCVVRKTPANGSAEEFVARSAPSSRTVVTITAINTLVLLSIPKSSAEVNGDIIEIYRTKGFTGTPDEEYALVGTVVITGFAMESYFDYLRDESRGATLYTSPSQEGALQENGTPPSGTDVALFKDSLFIANTDRKASLTLTMLRPPKVRLVTGLSNIGGEPWISGFVAADFDYLRVGQAITQDTLTGGRWWNTDGARVPKKAVIAQLSPGTNEIRLDRNCFGVGAAAIGIYVRDTITIDGVKLAAGSSADIALAPSGVTRAQERVFSGDDGGASYPSLATITSQLAFAHDSADVIDGAPTVSVTPFALPNSTEAGLYIESLTFGGGDTNVSVISVTAAGETPVFAESTKVTTGDSNTETAVGAIESRENALWWSKAHQPEHFPPVNYAPVGTASEPILRIIPTRDALFIFKREGIWRLTGDGANGGWRIDPFDMSTQLVGTATPAVLNDRIYCLTNKGVSVVSDGGVRSISEATIGVDINDRVERLLRADQIVAIQHGLFGFAKQVDNLYLLGMPSASDIVTNTSDQCEKVYVYNTKTGAWTTWDLQVTCGSVDAGDQAILFGDIVAGAWTVRREKFAITDDDYNSDAVTARTISSFNAATKLVTLAAGAVLAVGDLIRQGGSSGLVVAVGGAANTYTVDNGTGFAAGACNVYASYASVMEFAAHVGASPGTRKQFRDVSWQFQDRLGVARATASFRSDRVHDPQSDVGISLVRPSSAVDGGPKPVRVIVPREAQRCALLWPRLTIQQAGAKWSVAGLTLNFKQGEERV